MQSFKTNRIMKFSPPLIETTLIRRYKRFLADVRMPDGEEITVHCPNPGAMMGLLETENSNQTAWISDSRNPKRKLRYTLELLQLQKGTLVGINTNRPNAILEETIEGRKFDIFGDFKTLRREVPYGKNSRIDILLEGEEIPDTYIEIKNVHLQRQSGLHEFPDSVTERGRKHLLELANIVGAGKRAIMVYLIQRDDGDTFSLARDCDPKYAEAFDAAMIAGVEAYAICCNVSTSQIVAERLIKIDEAVLNDK